MKIFELKEESNKKIRIWFQDEAKFGLITDLGKRLTKIGVKPIGKKVFKREWYWLYGAVEPLSGETLYFEYNKLDGICFEDFLKKLSKEYPTSTNLVVLDSCGGHINQEIEIPKNVILEFLPPCSPELNPQERIWEEFRKWLKGKTFYTLKSLRKFLKQELNKMTKKQYQSLSFFPYIKEALQ